MMMMTIQLLECFFFNNASRSIFILVLLNVLSHLFKILYCNFFFHKGLEISYAIIFNPYP